MTTGLIAPKRALGSITADVTVRETSTDELMITEHPVEQGAAITDHAYKKPATLTLELAWSNSSDGAAGNDRYVREVYAKLLALQASRTPFDVVTGKRDYSGMLARSIALTTDEKTEYALFVTVICQQVILVSTSTTTVPLATLQKTPAQTAAVVPRGTVQPQPTGPAPPVLGGAAAGGSVG